MGIITEGRQDRPPPIRSGDELVYSGQPPYIVINVVRNGIPLQRAITGLPPSMRAEYEKDRCLAHASTTAAEHQLRTGTPWYDGEGRLHVLLV
jgi:hypothetical protein